MPAIYDSVQGNHPAKNRFDLSHSHFLTMKVGKIYCGMALEMYPGDVFRVSDAVHCQLQPMVAPLLTDLNLYAYTFFVPYRLLYGVDTLDGKSLWEKYITGGDDGDYDTPLPAWNPDFEVTGFASDTIWDSVGNPVACTIDDTDPDDIEYTWTPLVPKDLLVSKAPKLAYNMIWNTFWRDENLQDEVDLDNEYLLYADWKKDYFTSSLEYQQFGTAPAMDVRVNFNYPSGSTFSSAAVIGDPTVAFLGSTGFVGREGHEPTTGVPLHSLSLDPMLNGNLAMGVGTTDVDYAPDLTGSGVSARVGDARVSITSTYNPIDFLNASASGIGFDVAQMRLMFAVQRLMELSMTGGHRYTEYLKAHFGVSPSDARLDRPEYVGGCVFPVNVSVSVQSSETGSTPQGNKVGIGNINDIQPIGSYRAEEYGIMMTLLCVRPKPVYQQGVNRQWLRQNRFEYYSPEFANLSEQAVLRAEIYVDPTDESTPDNGVFGYQAHWNELRASQNYVSGAMREQFDYWLMSRKFSTRPALNDDFISLEHPEEYNRIWAVQDEDQFIVAWSNIVDAYRPLPAFGTPGLIDHVYGGK